MRYWMLGLSLLLTSCAPREDAAPEAGSPAVNDDFIDPLIADGEHYLLELENDYVRVLREKLAGGEGGAMHSHRARVQVFLKDAEVEIIPRGGAPTLVTLEAGTAVWTEPTTHVGLPQSDIENISIELKDLSDEEVPQSDVDATLVDPEHHVVEFENDRVRVALYTYAAGETSPVHDHPPGFAVFLTNADLRNIPEDGEPVTIQYEAGETRWGDASAPHATENVGDEDAVIIRVEMKKKPM